MLSLFLLALPALAAPDEGYIQADVIRLRSRPSASSRVVARLPINTRVSVVAESGERVKVRSAARPDVVGWIDVGYLSEHPLAAEGALQASVEAETLRESVVWAERALAISPTPEVIAHAERLATDLPAEEAEQLRQRVAAAGATWFAWCEGGRATLLGRLDGESWTYAVDTYPTDSEAQVWSRRVPPGLDTIAFSSGWSQTHFPNPRLVEMNEIMDDEDSATGDVVDLGSCTEPGLLASPSAQLEVIRKSSHGSLYSTEAVELDGVEYAQRVDGGLVEGYRTKMKPFFSCGGDAEVRPAIEAAIFDSDGRPLRPFGQHRDSDLGYAPFSISHPSWLRVHINGEPTTVFTSGEGHGLSSAAWMVFIRPDGTTHAQQLITRTYGC